MAVAEPTRVTRKGAVLGIVMGMGAGVLGCATAQPFAPSSAQQARFDQVVREAEAAGVNDGPRDAATLLAEAKSTWAYAQHLPKYPERARELAAKAQHDAETALMMARTTAPAVVAPVAPAPDRAAPVAEQRAPVATHEVAAADHLER